MAGSETVLRAVTLLDGSPIRAAADLLLYGAGFGKPALCMSVPALEADLLRLRSDVVVIDLALCGLEGMSALASVVRAAQNTPVIAVVPFDSLREPARATGAAEVATPLDLRPLVRCFEWVRGMAHAGLVCDCCRRRPAARRRAPHGLERG